MTETAIIQRWYALVYLPLSPPPSSLAKYLHVRPRGVVRGGYNAALITSDWAVVVDVQIGRVIFTLGCSRASGVRVFSDTFWPLSGWLEYLCLTLCRRATHESTPTRLSPKTTTKTSMLYSRVIAPWRVVYIQLHICAYVWKCPLNSPQTPFRERQARRYQARISHRFRPLLSLFCARCHGDNDRHRDAMVRSLFAPSVARMHTDLDVHSVWQLATPFFLPALCDYRAVCMIPRFRISCQCDNERAVVVKSLTRLSAIIANLAFYPVVRFMIFRLINQGNKYGG